MLVDYSHCPLFHVQAAHITVSTVHGSAIGQASCTVNAADLTTPTAGNLMPKCADNTCIVIATADANSRSTELDCVDRWVQNYNLRLNSAKSADIIFTSGKCKHADCLPQ